jgi:hypothetical protein
LFDIFLRPLNNFTSISKGLFSNFLVIDGQGAGLIHEPPNLEDQVIFDQGFLLLALDMPVSDCRQQC